MNTISKTLPFLLAPLFFACTPDDLLPPDEPPMMMEKDTTAPAFAGAGVADASPNAITITWKAATDDKDAAAELVYLVYSSKTKGGQNFAAAPLAITQPGVTKYTATALDVSTTYYFVVRSRDKAGNTDGNTTEVSATTPADKDTMAPTFNGVSGGKAGGRTVTLSWTAAMDNTTKAADIVYHIYQAETSMGQKFAMPTYMTASGATTFTTPDLERDKEYFFVVRAQDLAGNIEMNVIEQKVMTTAGLAKDVQPIFDANCTAGCHSGAMPKANLDLSSAAKSFAGLVGVKSIQVTTLDRVKPTEPDNSYLIKKLEGTGMLSQMPKNAAPLPMKDIATVKNWITGGASDK